MRKFGAIFGAAWLGMSLYAITGYSLLTWQYHVITLPTFIGFWLYLKNSENN